MVLKRWAALGYVRAVVPWALCDVAFCLLWDLMSQLGSSRASYAYSAGLERAVWPVPYAWSDRVQWVPLSNFCIWRLEVDWPAAWPTVAEWQLWAFLSDLHGMTQSTLKEWSWALAWAYNKPSAHTPTLAASFSRVLVSISSEFSPSETA